MNFMRKSQKRKGLESLLFILIISLALFFGVSCGGGDDDNSNSEIQSDDDTDEVPSNNISGVWKITSIAEDFGDGNIVTTDFPYIVEYLEFTVNGYARVTDDSISYYIGMENLPEGALYSNGIFYCSEEAVTYETDGNSIETDDGRKGVFEMNGDQATLTIQDMEELGNELTLSLKRIDGSEIYDAEENCEVYETFPI